MKWRLPAILFCTVLPATSWATCWQQAGQRYDIDPLLLYAIGEQETGLRSNVISYNRDGSYDIGLMQINSRHLPQLARQGISKAKLLNDSCLSVMVSASILSGFIQRMGSTWEAVGAYNAGSAPPRRRLRQRYAQQVWQRYVRLSRQRTELTAATRGLGHL